MCSFSSSAQASKIWPPGIELKPRLQYKRKQMVVTLKLQVDINWIGMEKEMDKNESIQSLRGGG